jgi:uncharacterized protein YqeY
MLKQRIQDDMKAALKGGEKARLGAVRLIVAALRQKEIDERIDLTDDQVVGVLEKMIKQRRDSIEQYRAAAREDLAEKEEFELSICESYMPPPLDEAAIGLLIDEAIAATGASGMRDMGQVMAHLRPNVQGRADMGAVSARVKAKLST